MNIPVIKQEGNKDCGVSCILSIIKYYKGNIPIEYLREISNTTTLGVNFLGLKKALETIGFIAHGAKTNDLNNLKTNLPCLVQVLINQKHSHFIVIYKINYKNKLITIMDPSIGIKTMKFEEFNKIFTGNILLINKVKEIPNIKKNSKIKEIITSLLKTNYQIIINIIIFSIVFTTISIISTYYFKIIIDNVIGSLNPFNLLIITIIFSLFCLIKYLTNMFREKLTLILNKKIDYFLLTNVYSHILSLPYTYFKNRTTGEIISRINDLACVRNVISKIILICLIDSVLLIVTSIILININSLLFYISLIILLSYILITIICSSIFKKYINNNQEQAAKVNSFLVESLSSYESIKGTNHEKIEVNKFKTKYLNLLNNIFKFDNFYNYYSTIKEFINALVIIIVIGIGTKLVMDQIITIGQLITFNSLLIYFYEPIKNILGLEPDIRIAINSVKRINNLLDIEKISNQENDKNISFKGNISFHNLNFSFDNYNYILNNVNFDIKKGDKVLINGESGVGKSTLVKLLMGYYKIKNNMIKIDENDINNFSNQDIRNNISYISQSEILINDTVYNNIVYDNEYPDSEVDKTIKLSMVNKVNIVKNNGNIAMIEENGFNISGGEKQRIVLARHILLNKNIMIIDEGTSAIDVNMERKILKELFLKMKNKTIIVISHHHENMDLYDQVVTLKKNEVESIRKNKDE